MFVFFILMSNTHKNVFLTLGITSMTICYHFTMRLVIGSVMARISLSQFDPDSFRFRERGFERKLYKALRVKKWKKFAPTYDDNLFDLTKNPIDNVIGETCRAESVHWLCAAAGLASIALTSVFGSLIAFLITGIISALVDMVFIVIQRYNRPRLMRYAAKRDK